MLDRNPSVPHVYLPEKHDQIYVHDNIQFEIQRDPAAEWERKLARFSANLPNHQGKALKTVIELLLQHRVRLTQTKLLTLANDRPGSELRARKKLEGYLKKVLSRARQEGLLTKKGHEGYGLPF